MYKDKYCKYKSLYLSTKNSNNNLAIYNNNNYFGVLKGGQDPDFVDGKDKSILDRVSDDELYTISDRIPERERLDNVDRIILKRQNFEGYDDDRGRTSTNDFITEDLDQTTLDIGLYGKIRGKILDSASTEFDKRDLTKSLSKPAKTKILLVDNLNSFDEFTQKFGKINKRDNRLYIEWNLVAQKYKGFYLKSSALGDREDDIPYMGQTVSNWVYYDFSNVDEIVLFKKMRNLIKSKNIKTPFTGLVVDEYAVNEDDFIKITDQVAPDKILLIGDVKSFDKFTNRYGVEKEKSYINIDWMKVKRDYDGFYIDKDNDFVNRDRGILAYYNGKLFTSWMRKENIEDGVVYLFD